MSSVSQTLEIIEISWQTVLTVPLQCWTIYYLVTVVSVWWTSLASIREFSVLSQSRQVSIMQCCKILRGQQIVEVTALFMEFCGVELTSGNGSIRAFSRVSTLVDTISDSELDILFDSFLSATPLVFALIWQIWPARPMKAQVNPLISL